MPRYARICRIHPPHVISNPAETAKHHKHNTLSAILAAINNSHGLKKTFTVFMIPEFQALLSEIDEFASRIRPRFLPSACHFDTGSRRKVKKRVMGAEQKAGAAVSLSQKSGGSEMPVSKKGGRAVSVLQNSPGGGSSTKAAKIEASGPGSRKNGAAMAGVTSFDKSTADQAVFVVDRFCKKFASASSKEQNTTVDLLESALFEIRLWFAVNSG